MNIVVQKFGGTSVENKETLIHVIQKIQNEVTKNSKVVVVVSAQGKTTDKLVDLANSHVFDGYSYPKEMDMLLSTGELQTVALLTMMLKEKGIEAIGLSGEQAGIITDSNYTTAQIQKIITQNITKYLENNLVVVVAGFQGVDKYGNITTFGRGGSDLTAVALASALKAKKCEIYTDVEGVYTSDPKIIKKAKLIKNISYAEMLAASLAGAKVLHSHCVKLAQKDKIKIIVKNTFSNNSGTNIIEDKKKQSGNTTAKILVSKDGFSKVSVICMSSLSNVEVVKKVYEAAQSINCTIYMLSITDSSINVIIETSIAYSFANTLHDLLFK